MFYFVEIVKRERGEKYSTNYLCQTYLHQKQYVNAKPTS